MFLSRFLSPQVETLVRSRGLRSVMQDTHLDVSVVCCDLRGFTAYVARTASTEVMGLLRVYYDAVNEAAQRHEATIKDYAGDGILMLVGAPLPLPDHARRAVQLAREVRAQAGAALRSRDAPLDVAVGVASGPVTVGVVGGAGRLEYAAVGAAVNLAARLCEHARGGEILLDAATVAQAGAGAGDAFQPRAPLPFKGMATRSRTTRSRRKRSAPIARAGRVLLRPAPVVKPRRPRAHPIACKPGKGVRQHVRSTTRARRAPPQCPRSPAYAGAGWRIGPCRRDHAQLRRVRQRQAGAADTMSAP